MSSSVGVKQKVKDACVVFSRFYNRPFPNREDTALSGPGPYLSIVDMDAIISTPLARIVAAPHTQQRIGAKTMTVDEKNPRGGSAVASTDTVGMMATGGQGDQS